MRCKKHCSDPSSSVGVCSSCLRERLSALIVAQAQAQAHLSKQHLPRSLSRPSDFSDPRKSDAQPPPLLFPRSVSPYVSRRKSDDTNPSSWTHHHLRFYSTPQVGPTSTATSAFNTTGSFPKKHRKFSLFSSLFRSRSDKLNPDPSEPSPSSSPSWFSNILSARRKKHSQMFSVEFPGRRNQRTSDRGMSPVRAEAEFDECDRSPSGSGCSSESPQAWKKTPITAGATRRGKHGRNVSGLAFCLSPLVRASPNRHWNHKSAGLPPDNGFSGEVQVKPHLSTAASFCAQPSPTSMVKVHRHEPQLITPTSPTPYEFKPLSDIDDQEGLRVQIPLIFFYPDDPSMKTNDPVELIKQSIAKALVYYYPIAGRIREGPNRKLIVECNGEGVMFIEAEANVSLDAFGDEIQPPFRWLDQLLFDVPGSGGIINSPLMLFQFMSAVAEMANGATAPSILPVWDSHILSARNPPRTTCVHLEYDELNVGDSNVDHKTPLGTDHRSFFFGPTQVSLIRRLVPYHLRNSSDFEILTAFVWKCRTIALQLGPSEEVRILCIVDARKRISLPVPIGYYGNCIAYSGARTTAAELCQNPLGFGVELIKRAKANVSGEYMQSVADLMVIKGRPRFTMTNSFLVSDATRASFKELDFGWGKAVYAGPAKGNVASFHIRKRNKKGEEGTVMTLCLPNSAMERFVTELGRMLRQAKTTLSAL